MIYSSDYFFILDPSCICWAAYYCVVNLRFYIFIAFLKFVFSSILSAVLMQLSSVMASPAYAELKDRGEEAAPTQLYSSICRAYCYLLVDLDFDDFNDIAPGIITT